MIPTHSEQPLAHSHSHIPKSSPPMNHNDFTPTIHPQTPLESNFISLTQNTNTNTRRENLLSANTNSAIPAAEPSHPSSHPSGNSKDNPITTNENIDNINTSMHSIHSPSTTSPRRNHFGSKRTQQLQMFMLGLCLTMMALSIVSKYDNLSSGVLYGTVLSLVSVILVLVSYVTEPSHRRHPNPLIFFRTLADSIFVLRLVAEQLVRCAFFDCKAFCNVHNIACGCNAKRQMASNRLCRAFAGILQFSIFSSECWFLCMSLNLYFSLTNPFTDFKRNTRFFHILSWGISTLSAIILVGNHDYYGYSDLGVCWTNALRGQQPVSNMETCPATIKVPLKDVYYKYKVGNSTVIRDSIKLKANFASWFFFYIWVVVFILVGIGVWLYALKRLGEGMAETYAIRVKSINSARFYVISVTLYWVVIVIFYIWFLISDAAKEHNRVYEIMNFLLAGKGYVDLILWFSMNEFKIPSFSSTNKPSIETVDVDLNPQVNIALRSEVLHYTTSGIIQAIESAEKLPTTQRIQHLALLPQRFGGTHVSDESMSAISGVPSTPTNATSYSAKLHTKTFHDYEPHAFRRIREFFNIDKERYMKSLSATTKERLSEGASGAFMFFSSDGALIVKSTSKEECRVLRRIAKYYSDFLCTHPNTLLTRFYGCHCLELYGNKFYFIVMANLFDTEHTIHRRYDIKGSWINRNAAIPRTGKRVTCRHCNCKYVYQKETSGSSKSSTGKKVYNASNHCPMKLGGHEPNVVLKDNDLTEQLKMDEDVASELYHQILEDSNFLCSFGIMDYSLLIGVHDVEYKVDDDGNKIGSKKKSETTSRRKRFLEVDDYRKYTAKECTILGERNSTVILETGSYSRIDDPSGTYESPFPLLSHHSPGETMRYADSVVGAAFYYLGIIDILQTWDIHKKTERYAKIILKRVEGKGLSAVPPKEYQTRFTNKVSEILGMKNFAHDNNKIDENRNNQLPRMHQQVGKIQEASNNESLSNNDSSKYDDEEYAI